jgi:hypothetical protein
MASGSSGRLPHRWWYRAQPFHDAPDQQRGRIDRQCHDDIDRIEDLGAQDQRHHHKEREGRNRVDDAQESQNDVGGALGPMDQVAKRQ